ncbi:uric acid-xanthine permease [Haematococcus lacustris]
MDPIKPKKSLVDCDCAAIGWRVPGRSWREFFFGTGFHWGFLCTPANPLKLYSKTSQRQPPHFFGVNDWLGIVTAIMVGAQHALAMVGGLIVPPLLIVPFGTPNGDDYKRYLVQAALIVTGVMTLVQVTGIRVGGKFMWGAGVLSVMGVSFTSVPIVQSTLAKLMKGEGMSFDEAYGHVLGTLCVSTLTPILFSFLPIKVLRKVFPPVVSGVTILLIGIHLTGAGLANWGGGSFCSQTGNYNKLVNGVPAPVLCTGNGQVMYPFGNGNYVGMGFLVFSTIIFIEILGSPFMRNCSAIIGLLFGYFIAAIIDVDGKRFVTSASFESAPAITFNWTKTFPLKFYGPAIIPLIVVAIITGIESVGDTAATIEASRMPVTDDEASLRIKGALFNDGISGLFSALATSLPLTTFAQNNGIISLTNVAARQSGWACGLWLILLGILGKVGAFVISIPNCVLGGMTTFLFANVMSSGIKIIVSEGNLDRRTRFIMACSLALGVGVELVPQWGNYWLWPVTPDMSSGTRGIRDAIALILSTSFCLAAITAFILNLLLPEDAHDEGLAAFEASKHGLALHPKGVYDPSISSDEEKGKATAVPPSHAFA